jgi:hypothetical protein
MASKLKCSITEPECKNSKNGKRADIDELAIKCGILNPESYSNREKLCAAIVAKYRETQGGGLSAPAPVSPASSIARSVTSTTSTTELPDDIKDYVLPPFKQTGDPTIEKLRKVADAVISQYNLDVRKSGTKEEIYRNVKNALDKIKSGKSETSTAPTKDFFDDLLGTKATIAVKPPTKILSKSEEEEKELERQLAEKRKARKEKDEREKADREKAAREAALALDRQKKEEQEREKARMLKEQEELRQKALIEEAKNNALAARNIKTEGKKRDLEDKPPSIAPPVSEGKGLNFAIIKSYLNVETKNFTTILYEIIDDIGSYSDILNKYGDMISDEKKFKEFRQDLSKVLTNNKSLGKFKSQLVSKKKEDIINYLRQKEEREERVLEVVNPVDQKVIELMSRNYTELSEDTQDQIISEIINELIKLSIKDSKVLKNLFYDIVKGNTTTKSFEFDDEVVEEIIEKQLYEDIPIATELIPVSVVPEEVPIISTSESTRKMKSPLNRRQRYIKDSILMSSGDNCYPEYGLDCPGDSVCDIDNNPPKCIDKNFANLKQKNIEGIDEYNFREKRIIGNKDTINTLKRILKDSIPENKYNLSGSYNIIDNIIRSNIENNVTDKDMIFTNVFSALQNMDDFSPEQLTSNQLKYYVKRMTNIILSEKEFGTGVIEPITEVVVSEPVPDIDSIIQKYKKYESKKVVLTKVKNDLNKLRLVVADEVLEQKIQNMLDAEEEEEEEEDAEEEEEEEEEVPVPDILPTISTGEIIERNMLPRLLEKTDDESSDRERQIKIAQNAVIKCLGLA